MNNWTISDWLLVLFFGTVFSLLLGFAAFGALVFFTVGNIW